ncbi:MAG: PqqD family protein [Acidobacteriota bacterium]
MKQNYPKSRTDEIVVQELNGEILVYDLRDNRAMCLNETSSAVWRACDGSNSVADIASRVGNEDIVWLALAELKKEKLIDGVPSTPEKFDGLSRRDVIKKIGLGSMIALPVIAGLVAPTAAHAASTCVVGAGTCMCAGPNTGVGNACTATTTSCTTGCVCRFSNNGNNNGVCAP